MTEKTVLKTTVRKYDYRNRKKAPNASPNIITSEEKPSYRCDQPGCNEIFTLQSNLKTHVECFHSDKPFHCDYPGCDKTYKYAGSLTNHKAIHFGVKLFQCNHPRCDKAFYNIRSLTLHMAVHNVKKGFQLFKCNHMGCDKAFRNLKYLLSHKRSHDDTIKGEDFAVPYCTVVPLKCRKVPIKKVPKQCQIMTLNVDNADVRSIADTCVILMSQKDNNNYKIQHIHRAQRYSNDFGLTTSEIHFEINVIKQNNTKERSRFCCLRYLKIKNQLDSQEKLKYHFHN